MKLRAEERKRRMSIPRHKMPEQDPVERGRNFQEVNYGYPPELAMEEAQRCIQCPKPKCVLGCPVNVKIPDFIARIAKGEFLEAAHILHEDNALPAVCGRVCPQEEQCEAGCILGVKGKPVAIGHLERFAADYEREHGQVEIPPIPDPTGKRIAIIGAGPSGLTVAGDLSKQGHDVTIFEALHTAGGVLMYGIPEFRLPKAIVNAEVDYLKQCGVKIETNAVIGKTYTIDELFENGFHAIYIANGAGLPKFMGIPGENLNGVYSANEYLTRSNLMKAYDFPRVDTPIAKGKNVAVFGGGNVAMDAVRTALRLGADNAYLIYRRSEVEMPARNEEIEHAKEEGIQFHLLTNPTRILGDENGHVKAVECLQMELGKPDNSGRRRPVPIEGSEFILDVDTVVVAIGTGANPLLAQTTPGLKMNRWGYIEADEQTGATSKPGVYAGGDIVRGAATVILAMGDGRTAAATIHDYVMSL
ncbi:glutamate synthase (NADPH), homotetrameric [candidate division KSB3 bacterium]|uniref:Glutamate synthase (NADPH), homotetrameric n=1 Tax=candidate division KSB3 bacterium TaxID=2044937 RepID=A0A2G6KBY8_9BACT|nr:MAG: glutamate synthase (NADPH), homotetrameric [candidate division KSB3 bacterium]